MQKYRIGIVGNGFVGRATAGFKCKDIEVLIYDKDKNKSDVNSLKDLNGCCLIFVCVPTPMNKDGSCNTDIVKQVVEELRFNTPFSEIVVRSTVPVGFCEKNNVSFMPEFLTEKNWKNDFKNTPLWIHGDKRGVCRFPIDKFLQTAKVHNKINSADFILTTPSEAETIKYIRNTFLALKVSYFNEIYDFCEAKEIDFDYVSQIASMDSRIGQSHIGVPGHDGKKGFGGTCFPKDLNSLLYQFSEQAIKSFILKAVLERNNNDRPEQDWQNLKGRAVV